MKSSGHAYDAVKLLLVSLGLASSAGAAPPNQMPRHVVSIPALETPAIEHFPTAAAAFEKLLRIPARVLAVGEYHQTSSTTDIRSSLSRFADEMLPVLARSATDLVVETWVATGACGARETKVEQDVETTTERPPETESEIVTLLKRAKAAGMAPHILTMSCKDYRFVTDERKGTDFAKLLKLTRDRLEAEVLHWLDEPAAAPGRVRTVAVYGGALHNDLYPAAADRKYAFGPSLFAKAKGEYLEIDLFVPEYIAADTRWSDQPWFRLWKQNRDSKDALCIRRSEHSFVILFPPSTKAASKGK